MKAISLFAGAGGCSLGFSNAGVDIIAAYENNPAAIDTYNLNFGNNKCKDVDLSECDFEELRNNLGLKRGQLELIIGGPPCQGFTTAGNRFWDDPRNKLVQNYANALYHFYPKWFMMENVEGILTTAQGKYLINCLEKMTEIGYTISLEKVYAQEYEVPQRRKRVIIIGNREGKAFGFPQAKEGAKGSIYRLSPFTLRQAIEDLELLENKENDHTFKIETGIQFKRISTLKPGQSMKDLPEELQHQSFKKRANRRVCDGMPTEKRGGAPSGLKRLIYDEPALTITSAAITEFIHPVQNRTLTIRECARIQTFPDTFIFCGTDRQKALQIGNAIPPRLAEQLAIRIKECDNYPSFVKSPGLVYYSVTKADAKSPALVRTCDMLDNLIQIQQENEQMRLSYGS